MSSVSLIDCDGDIILIWPATTHQSRSTWLQGQRTKGLRGCAILTELARGIAVAIHSRMPVVLDDDSLELWLNSHLTDHESIRGAVGACLLNYSPIGQLTTASGM